MTILRKKIMQFNYHQKIEFKNNFISCFNWLLISIVKYFKN